VNLNMRQNYQLFNDASRAAYVVSGPSNIIKYNNGSALTWTPGSGKSIYLTAVQIAGLISTSLNITLSGSVVGKILTVELTSAINTYTACFLSPVQFSVNESLSASASPGITLIGYEL
jgi:hypothetical protein